MNTPVETVKSLYEAFSRGDLPAIQACLANDVLWEYDSAPNPVPWLQPLRGRDQVARFFETLMSSVSLDMFQPHRFLADERCVVVLVDADLTVRATGRRIVERDEVHLWHFGDDGRVQRFRHRADTWAHAMALRGDVPSGH